MSAFNSAGAPSAPASASNRYTRTISLASPGQRKVRRVETHSGSCIGKSNLRWQSHKVLLPINGSETGMYLTHFQELFLVWSCRCDIITLKCAKQQDSRKN